MQSNRAVRPTKRRVGELLVDAELVSESQIAEALAIQKEEGGKIVQILINLGHLDASKLAAFLSGQPGVASIDLSQYSVSEDVVALVPREFAIRNELFPIDRLGKLLTVGMAFPLDTETVTELETMTGLRVKTLLCNKDDIRNAIENYYETDGDDVENPAVQAERASVGARVESVASLIRQIDALPALPQTVERVQAMASSPDIAMKEIADIVAADPGISARLLQLANSSAYGFTGQVDNVHLATSLLGLRETLMVVTSSAVIDLTAQSPAFDHAGFWKHSMRCAVAARKLAAAANHPKTTGIFTAGLLCDIGRFALCESAPSRYAKLPANLNDVELRAAEEKALGLGHPEAGYILAAHWQLPVELSEPIRFHLAPELAQDSKSSVAIVAIASRIVDATEHGEPWNAEVFTGVEDALGTLNIEADTALAACENLDNLPAEASA